MKLKPLFASMVALMIGFAATPAMADDASSIINQTGMDITHLYVSASNEDDWGDDILGRDILENGEECELEWAPDDDECKYDVKIVDGNGKAWTVAAVDFCKYTKLTFKKQSGKVVYTAR